MTGTGAAERPEPRRLPWRVAAFALTIVCTVPLVARFTGFEEGALAILAVAATPYVVIVGGAAAVVGLVARTPVLAGACLAACLVAAGTQLPLFFVDSGSEDRSDTPSLVLLTANVGGGAADPAEIMRAIVTSRPDVVALQALSPTQVETLSRMGMDRVLPHRFVDVSEERAGSGLWSRTELTETRTLPGFAWPQIAARVEVPRLGQVTVVSVHPVSPRPGLVPLWRQEQRRLGLALTALSGTVIALGDFNASYDHRSMRGLRSRGFADAADQAGAGLTPTWAQWGSVPALIVGIDRVMLRGPLTARDVDVLASNGSPHRPVLARLVAAAPN